MKEFEALKRIETTFNLNKQNRPSVYNDYTNSVEPYYRDYDLVEKALLELKQIKETKPSEALERILNNCEEIDIHNAEEDKTGYRMYPDVLIVQKALKALKIIIEKKVIIWALAETDKCSQYNVCVALAKSDFKEKIGIEFLDEEEFNTVKEVLAGERLQIL